jgi:hypothetical protein
MTGDSDARASAQMPATSRDSQPAQDARDAFRALLAPLRMLDAPHARPATVLDVPPDGTPT